MEKVSSMLLSGLVPEVPSSTCRCQHIRIHWDKPLVLIQVATIFQCIKPGSLPSLKHCNS